MVPVTGLPYKLWPSKDKLSDWRKYDTDYVARRVVKLARDAGVNLRISASEVGQYIKRALVPVESVHFLRKAYEWVERERLIERIPVDVDGALSFPSELDFRDLMVDPGISAVDITEYSLNPESIPREKRVAIEHQIANLWSDRMDELDVLESGPRQARPEDMSVDELTGIATEIRRKVITDAPRVDSRDWLSYSKGEPWRAEFNAIDKAIKQVGQERSGYIRETKELVRGIGRKPNGSLEFSGSKYRLFAEAKVGRLLGENYFIDPKKVSEWKQAQIERNILKMSGGDDRARGVAPVGVESQAQKRRRADSVTTLPRSAPTGHRGGALGGTSRSRGAAGDVLAGVGEAWLSQVQSVSDAYRSMRAAESAWSRASSSYGVAGPSSRVDPVQSLRQEVDNSRSVWYAELTSFFDTARTAMVGLPVGNSWWLQADALVQSVNGISRITELEARQNVVSAVAYHIYLGQDDVNASNLANNLIMMLTE